MVKRGVAVYMFPSEKRQIPRLKAFAKSLKQANPKIKATSKNSYKGSVANS